MPKSRNSGSLGNRNQEAPTINEREMSDRIEQRLRDAGDVEVEVVSRSRGTAETVRVNFGEGGMARVFSGSGSEYIVDTAEDTCTCPDYVNRQRRCRHLEATDIARQEISPGTFQGSATDVGVSPNQVISEVVNNEIASELRNTALPQEDDGFFYTDNTEAFRQDVARLASEPVPYYYENVLNGANTTFGIELEFVDGDSDAIANELYSLGLCGSQIMTGYHSRGIAGRWKLESDGSVTSGRRGGELISPILKDTPDTWRQIETVCEVARRHGAQLNLETGGHVHIGAEEPLDGKRQRWRRFFKITAGFEEVYFKLAGGEQGRFRGGHYAVESQNQSRCGISCQLPQAENLVDYQNAIYEVSEGKYRSMNISSFASDKKTIEFRAFNGTLTPGIIQANVKYAAGVINSSEKSRVKQSEGVTVTDSDRKRGSIINAFDTNNGQNDESIMRAMDAIFSRKIDKEHLLSVITKNSWQMN